MGNTFRKVKAYFEFLDEEVKEALKRKIRKIIIDQG